VVGVSAPDQAPPCLASAAFITPCVALKVLENYSSFFLPGTGVTRNQMTNIIGYHLILLASAPCWLVFKPMFFGGVYAPGHRVV